MMRSLVAGFVLCAFATSTRLQTTPLPAVDARCTRDSDCGVVLFYLDGADTCCGGCGISTPGNKKWVADVTKACASYVVETHKSCPALACPTGRTTTECKAGACVLK
jgi:hypothetical protein